MGAARGEPRGPRGRHRHRWHHGRLVGRAELGVHSLTAENARTPEGIGPGSTYADVRRVYPEPSDPDDTLDEQLALLGAVWPAVPGHPDTMYAITFDTSRLTDRRRLGSATVQVVVLKLKADERC
ncbi:hypothetical protein [Streptomyces sp. NPDC052015]|uniref:hypothetical protein n=1 Tax=Streptomyces sp. NPDC052015 TaxID=3154755 RepID=UPI003421159E